MRASSKCEAPESGLPRRPCRRRRPADPNSTRRRGCRHPRAHGWPEPDAGRPLPPRTDSLPRGPCPLYPQSWDSMSARPAARAWAIARSKDSTAASMRSASACFPRYASQIHAAPRWSPDAESSPASVRQTLQPFSISPFSMTPGRFVGLQTAGGERRARFDPPCVRQELWRSRLSAAPVFDREGSARGDWSICVSRTSNGVANASARSGRVRRRVRLPRPRHEHIAGPDAGPVRLLRPGRPSRRRHRREPQAVLQPRPVVAISRRQRAPRPLNLISVTSQSPRE